MYLCGYASAFTYEVIRISTGLRPYLPIFNFRFLIFFNIEYIICHVFAVFAFAFDLGNRQSFSFSVLLLLSLIRNSISLIWLNK